MLTHRIAYVIATRGVHPEEICAVTFTNKAAREMRSRVEQLIGASIKGMWLGTFHALGARLLRRDGDAINIARDYTIYDEADRTAAIRNALRAEGIDEKRYTPSRVANVISTAKNELIDARDYMARANGEFERTIGRAYYAYEQELDAASALDFDDLLFRAVVLLRDAESVRRYYQHRFQHLFIDEYQDTNHAQYELVKLLAAEHRNLTVVGDDDQCLLAGTLVSMADGTARPIELVRPGDQVMSAYGAGSFAAARVERAAARTAQRMVRIRTEAGRTLTSTPEHTHFAGPADADDRQVDRMWDYAWARPRTPTLDVVPLPFTRAEAVAAGMVMLDETGERDTVRSVERIGGTFRVHDLDIERTHNFVANGLVTHNSVYGFRGADVRNILAFERDYPDATTVTLEQNYRSTQPILDVAHSVIKRNEQRAEKKLWTDHRGGEPVRLISVYDEREEALWIAGEIERLVGREGVSLSECAVLYRTNAQSRAFEEVLLRRGIPYRLVGGIRFYERKEVKDVLAYLRLCANPRDAVSFARVVNVPRRKIGDRTVAELERLARRKRIAPLEAARQLDAADGLGQAAMQAIAGFSSLMDRLRDEASRVPLPILVDSILVNTGYRDMVRDGTPEGEERWGNVVELSGLAAEYEDVPPPDGLTQFLENVALVSDVDSVDDKDQGVLLITLHQVKGLEFDVVFVAGMEEGLLPHVRALEEGDAGVAEERRLTYVGMTRARRHLYLLHAFRRHLYGTPQLAEASRFLREIPPDLIELAARPGGRLVDDMRRPGSVRQAVHARAVQANPVVVAPQRYREGMRVRHERYGEGTVLKSTMTRSGEELVIKFDDAGVKIFAVSDATLWPVQSGD